MPHLLNRNSRLPKYLRSSRGCFGSKVGEERSPRAGIVEVVVLIAVGRTVVIEEIVGVGDWIGGTMEGDEIIGGRDGERETGGETVSEDGVEICGEISEGCMGRIGSEGVVIRDEGGFDDSVRASVARRGRGLVFVGSRRLLANSTKSDALLSSLTV
jgi:hypothetical protein